jgi:peptide/nickel transport system permease protein
MRSYLLKRLLLMIPTLLGISLISFVIIQLAPGDPAELRMGSAEQQIGNQQLAEQIIQETRALYGLDQPLHIQYWRWLKRILTLDFGASLRDHRPISEKLKERLPVSIKLSGISLILAYLISIPLGIYSATHQYSIGDRITTVVLFALYSLPNFWIATMAIVYLGGGDFWNVFPVYGLQSIGAENWTLWQRIQDQAWHLILPITCMTYYTFAVLSRYMRAGMLEVIRQDFIRTARAKGLSERVVVYRHALRNSLIPIVTLMADLLPALIGGSIVVETIFTIPGMGQLSFESVLNRDYPLIMAIFTFSALLTLVGILLADLLYTIVDPRIAYEKRAAA